MMQNKKQLGVIIAIAVACIMAGSYGAYRVGVAESYTLYEEYNELSWAYDIRGTEIEHLTLELDQWKDSYAIYMVEAEIDITSMRAEIDILNAISEIYADGYDTIYIASLAETWADNITDEVSNHINVVDTLRYSGTSFEYVGTSIDIEAEAILIIGGSEMDKVISDNNFQIPVYTFDGETLNKR